MSSNYDSLLKSLRELKRELQLKKTERSETETTIITHRKESDSLQSKLNEEIKTQREQALKTLEKEKSAPLEKKIKDLNSKKSELESKYKSACSELTFDNYKDRYERELEIVNKAKDSMTEVETRVADILGKNFSDNLYRQLNNSTVELDIQDLSELSRRLSRFDKNIEILSKKPKIDFAGVVDTVLKKLNPCKDETAEGAVTNDIFLYIGMCAVLSVFTLSVGSPYLILGLTTLGGLNIYKGYSTYRIALESKLLSDNIARIDDMVDNQVNEELEEAKNQLTDIFETNVNKLKTRISQLEDKLEQTVMEVRESFNFDETPIIQKYDLRRRNINEDIKRIQLSIDRIDTDIAKINRDINRVEGELSKCTDSLAEHYLSTKRVGDEYLLNPRFLLDIDKNVNKPIFYDFSKETTLFIYEDYEDISNFIRLILVQLMNRLHVGSLEIKYWDFRYQASAVQQFNSLDINYFDIRTTTQDEFDKSIEIIRKKEDNRHKQIEKEHRNIDEYNEFMLNSKSVPESYIFLFIIWMEYKKLLSPPLYSVIRNGARVGMYPFIFIEEKELLDLKDDAIKLLDLCPSVYNVSRAGLQPRAKKDIIKKLEENK